MDDEVTTYEGLTLDDLRVVLDDSLATMRDVEQTGFDSLSQDVRSLGDTLTLLYSQNEDEGESTDEVVYTVRLDPSQVGTFRSAAQVACTEGLLLVLLLALSCGLQAWRILAGGWRNG